MTNNYYIIRTYYPTDDNPHSRHQITRRRLSLEEAQQHCKDPATMEEGVFFDGYDQTTTSSLYKGCKGGRIWSAS